MSGPSDDAPVALAVETAGRVASLCLLDRNGERELVELDPAGRRNARTLVPEAVALCDRHGLKLADVGLVCVALGPGSFTGLRTGVTFAKTLAFAVSAAGGRCDAVGVPSHMALELFRLGLDTLGVRHNVVSDALRGQFYLSTVTRHAVGEPPVADGPRLVSSLEGLSLVLRVGENSHLSSDAMSVLEVGLQRWRAGLTDDPHALAPLYVRRSAAEEKADAAGTD